MICFQSKRKIVEGDGGRDPHIFYPNQHTMKKLTLTLFAAATLALTGCANVNPTTFIKKFTKNNVGQAIYNTEQKTLTVHYAQDSLWSWNKAKANGFKSATLCIDGVQGKIQGTVVLDSTHALTKHYGKK